MKRDIEEKTEIDDKMKAIFPQHFETKF